MAQTKKLVQMNFFVLGLCFLGWFLPPLILSERHQHNLVASFGLSFHGSMPDRHFDLRQSTQDGAQELKNFNLESQY